MGKCGAQAAKELIEKTFEKLKTTTSLTQGETNKIFPHGMELIYVKFKFSSVEFKLKVAGAAGVKGKLGGNQTLSWEQISSDKNSMEGV
jgi:hypothetical protein